MTTQPTRSFGSHRLGAVLLAALLMVGLLPGAVLAAAPTVLSVNRTSATPTTATTVAWTVTFSESVTGVNDADFALATTGTASGAAPTSSGSGATYTVTVTSVVGDGTLCVNVLDDNSIINGTTESLASAFTCTQTYAVDNTNPSATTINRSGTTPTAATSVSWAVTFSESVTGVNAGDFSLVAVGVSGASITSVSGTGSSYTVTAGTGSGSGTLGLNLVDDDSIADGVGQQLGGAGAGNGNFTGEIYDINKAGPTVTINQAVGQVDPTGISPISFTVVFSEAVTGFATGDVTVSGTAGATTGTVSGGPTTYAVAVTGMTTAGTVIASIPADAADGGGDPSAPSTSTDNQVSWDPTPPTVIVNRASGQQDLTGTSPIVFSVVFSENVTGFASGDIAFTGSTAGGTLLASIGGSSGTASYTVSVTGMTTSGNVVIVVATGAASDVAGNTSAAPTNTDNSVVWDSVAGPTVTINQASSQADPTGASPINFTVIFSAAVTGFATGDVVLGGTAGATTGTVTGGPTTYNVAVSGMTSGGTVIAAIPADVAIGTSGAHPTKASTSSDNNVTFRLASKYIVTSSNTTPVPGTVVTITAQLADAANVAVPTAGLVVTWSKTGTGGSFASATSTTNSSGIATVAFTVATVSGTVHTVTATSPGGIIGTSANINVTAPAATITLTNSASVITWGGAIVLNVQFGANGGGKAFILEGARDGVTFATIANLTTNGSGFATLLYTPVSNLFYRVRFLGTSDLLAANSNTTRTVVRQIALLRPTNSGATKSIARNTSVKFTTTVRPSRPELPAAKVSFVFYKKVGGVWTLVSKRDVYINSLGLSSWTWKFTSAGSWYVRSIANPTPYNANSVWSQLEFYTVR